MSILTLNQETSAAAAAAGSLRAQGRLGFKMGIQKGLASVFLNLKVHTSGIGVLLPCQSQLFMRWLLGNLDLQSPYARIISKTVKTGISLQCRLIYEGGRTVVVHAGYQIRDVGYLGTVGYLSLHVMRNIGKDTEEQKRPKRDALQINPFKWSVLYSQVPG